MSTSCLFSTDYCFKSSSSFISASSCAGVKEYTSDEMQESCASFDELINIKLVASRINIKCRILQFKIALYYPHVGNMWFQMKDLACIYSELVFTCCLYTSIG
ncbi:Hypothetical_protein [Hexamita inflata]|uniref:Hypothetical_protein n=1 Tax=Hexamita inflata TaxID=28002 RepID=A0AA86UVC7_9EUKA|nr:Hypothetical protein HINF_LOCUS56939 [Hexamita inflata]